MPQREMRNYDEISYVVTIFFHRKQHTTLFKHMRGVLSVKLSFRSTALPPRLEVQSEGACDRLRSHKPCPTDRRHKLPTCEACAQPAA